MRPFVVHILILTPLIILGIASFAIEALDTSHKAHLRYIFTICYWLALIGYSLVSTFIVLSVSLFYKIKKRSFTKIAVILSHVILIGVLYIFVSSGLYSLTANAWKNRNFFDISQKVQIEQTERKPFPIPTAPVTEKFKYKTPGGMPVEPDKQKSK